MGIASAPFWRARRHFESTFLLLQSLRRSWRHFEVPSRLNKVIAYPQAHLGESQEKVQNFFQQPPQPPRSKNCIVGGDLEGAAPPETFSEISQKSCLGFAVTEFSSGIQTTNRHFKGASLAFKSRICPFAHRRDQVSSRDTAQNGHMVMRRNG